MFKRMGNKFFLRGYMVPLAIIETKSSIDTFKVDGFIVKINSVRIDSYSGDYSNYIETIDNALAYANGLKCCLGSHYSKHYTDMWENEEYTTENLKWKQENVWGKFT